MPQLKVNNLGGLNLYVNPLDQKEGAVIRAVNVDSYPYGAKTKRSGYSTFLGTPDNAQVNQLFSFYKENGTDFWLYRASGSVLYYSYQGTGTWTVCGNGTISNGAHIGNVVLADTLMIGDGVGSTRHSTSGTSFTNTTLAPVASRFEEYQRRVYVIGTSSTTFYSTTNDPTNWNTSGTSDSSSFTIPGAGKLQSIFKVNDRLNFTKTSGAMFKWDGFSLIDSATKLGPTSPDTLAKVEDYQFFINRLGHYGYGGGRAQLLSNAVQPQFYNNAGSGVVGTAFDSMVAGAYRYDYLASLGTVTDDITNMPINNAILKYNYQKNEYLNYQFGNVPTAMHQFRDVNKVDQFIFGDSTGQVYQLSGTTTTDNGSAIEASLIFLVHAGVPYFDKKFNWYWFFFNPGCEAKIQIAIGNTYRPQSLNWIDLGDCSSGVCEGRFPQNTRGKILFVKVYESSRNSPFSFYGAFFDYDVIPV